MTLPSTRLTDCLDLEVPVVQAPIGSATCPALAAAVADGGALGTLAVTWRDEAETRRVLRDTLDRTEGAVAVNVVVDENARSVPVEDQVRVCLEAGVEVFSFSFGEVPPEAGRIHDAGGVVLQSVGDPEAARRAVEAGADVVVAQGWEAGGHVDGEVATMPLVPRVVDAVPETPVVAAGGIADGRGVAAALALGADGAWIGTRFLATEEANVHDRYRDRVLDADATEIAFSTLFDEGWPGVPHRVVENETVERWRAAGKPDTDRPGEGEVIAEMPDGELVERYEDSLAVPGASGDVVELPLYAGQSAGLTDDVCPAEELVATLSEEAATAIERIGR